MAKAIKVIKGHIIVISGAVLLVATLIFDAIKKDTIQDYLTDTIDRSVPVQQTSIGRTNTPVSTNAVSTNTPVLSTTNTAAVLTNVATVNTNAVVRTNATSLTITNRAPVLRVWTNRHRIDTTASAVSPDAMNFTTA